VQPISLEAVERAPKGDRVISKQTAAQLIAMMEGVVSPAGTGQRAAIKNFSVAGKTGTAWISGVGGYSGDRYTAVFGGIAPASDPRLVAVVVIDDPKGQAYYGGDIAAPVFSRIVAGALRVLAVAPDALPDPPLTVVAQAQVGP
jgi:cell division protein FtsI (penicillin-binding protein 3)